MTKDAREKAYELSKEFNQVLDAFMVGDADLFFDFLRDNPEIKEKYWGNCSYRLSSALAKQHRAAEGYYALISLAREAGVPLVVAPPHIMKNMPEAK